MLARGEAFNILANPLFRQGYDMAWRGEDRSVETCWEVGERRAYNMGFDFALYLQNDNHPRLPLSKHGLPNSEAAVALLCASLSLEVHA